MSKAGIISNNAVATRMERPGAVRGSCWACITQGTLLGTKALRNARRRRAGSTSITRRMQSSFRVFDERSSARFRRGTGLAWQRPAAVFVGEELGFFGGIQPARAAGLHHCTCARHGTIMSSRPWGLSTCTQCPEFGRSWK